MGPGGVQSAAETDKAVGALLTDLKSRGLLELQKDEKSGGQLILGFGPNA